jgi:RNA polymerase sigma-70 factor, ECF subfamily
MNSENQAEIIRELTIGSERAFEKFFFHHKDRVYTIAFTYTESQPDAEEIVQDTFLRIWKNRHKLTEIENLQAWLYTITRNLALTALKRIATEGKRKQDLITWLPAEITNADMQSEDHEMQSLLQKALSVLSPRQRRIFELSRLKGTGRAAIAKELGLCPATVSVHLTIALRKVRAFLLSKKNLTN